MLACEFTCESMARRAKYSGSLYRRGNSPIWQMQWLHDGVLYRESSQTANKEEAGKLLKTRLSGSQREAAIKHTTVEEVATLYLKAREAKWKPNTIEWANGVWNNIKPVFGQRSPASILPANIDVFVSRLKAENYSECYINRHLTVLKAILRFAVRNKALREIPEFPAKFNEAPYVRQGWIDDWDFIVLCDEIDDKDTWMLALVTAAFTFGFRKSELLYMRVNQIDHDRHTITLPAGSTKNKMPRRIVLNPESKLSKLLAQITKGKAPHAYVFSRDAQGSIPVRDFRVAWDKIVTAAKIKTGSGPDGALQFHDLRRSAISRMASIGLPEEERMVIAGHLTADVHRRYRHLSDGAARRIAAKIDLPE